VLVVGGAARREVTQAPQAVAISVAVLDLLGRVLGVEQPALLDRQQEDQPIGEPQQFAEVGFFLQRAIVQRPPQGLVGRVRQEALAQAQQGIFEADPQAVARDGPLFARGLVPQLQDAPIGILGLTPEARAVQQQPSGGEVWV
jgi:hypothetical protein